MEELLPKLLTFGIPRLAAVEKQGQLTRGGLPGYVVGQKPFPERRDRTGLRVDVPGYPREVNRHEDSYTGAVYSAPVAQELSTKWYNVIRRELRASAVTYIGDLPDCPDCGSDTYLTAGRYGRYYKCENFGCSGTVGARLDGTPRKPRGSPEILEARRRVREAVAAVLVEERRKPLAPNIWLPPGQDYMEVGPILSRILERAEVEEYRLFGGRVREGLYLRQRSLEELRRIEAAAKEELRALRWTPYWTRLIREATDLVGA